MYSIKRIEDTDISDLEILWDKLKETDFPIDNVLECKDNCLLICDKNCLVGLMFFSLWSVNNLIEMIFFGLDDFDYVELNIEEIMKVHLSSIDSTIGSKNVIVMTMENRRNFIQSLKTWNFWEVGKIYGVMERGDNLVILQKFNGSLSILG